MPGLWILDPTFYLSAGLPLLFHFFSRLFTPLIMFVSTRLLAVLFLSASQLVAAGPTHVKRDAEAATPKHQTNAARMAAGLPPLAPRAILGKWLKELALGHQLTWLAAAEARTFFGYGSNGWWNPPQPPKPYVPPSAPHQNPASPPQPSSQPGKP